jgi:hypothetical protein
MLTHFTLIASLYQLFAVTLGRCPSTRMVMESYYVNRAIESEFAKRIQPRRVLVIYGPRRVGKTELIQRYLSGRSTNEYLLLNGDDQAVQRLLEERSEENYRRILGSRKLLVIDEAQKIPEIGIKLKLIVDQIHDVRVVATGSSVFDLENQLGEPLVGRKHTLRLYPLSVMELAQQETLIQTASRLEERLIFGGYPELLHLPDQQDKIAYLNEMVSSYLLRDILEFEGIRKADKLRDLLRLIAFQIGKPVNLEELGNALQLSKNTIERYLDLLSKVFVVFKVNGFSRSLRKEVTKMSRWYFYDNGIRNALIQNFNPMSLRSDAGELWENFAITERLKYMDYSKRSFNYYFWRTYDQQELDWVEEEAGEIRGYEMKWNPTRKPKAPGAWTNAYPEAKFQVIHSGNYLDWVI